MKLLLLSMKTYELVSHICFRHSFVCSMTLFASLSFFRGRIEDTIIRQSGFICWIVNAISLFCLTMSSTESPSERLLVPAWMITAFVLHIYSSSSSAIAMMVL